MAARLVSDDETKKDSCNTNMLHSYWHIMYTIILIFKVPIYKDQTWYKWGYVGCGLSNKIYSIKEIIVLIVLKDTTQDSKSFTKCSGMHVNFRLISSSINECRRVCIKDCFCLSIVSLLSMGHIL